MSVATDRVTTASAAAGAGLWLVLAVAGVLDDVALLLTLAPLVLVPVALSLVATPTRTGREPTSYRLAVWLQPPGALAATLSVLFPTGRLAGVLAVGWLLVTIAVAAFGLWRFLPRGASPLEELLVDAGCLYLPVASLALVAHRFDASFVGFTGFVVLLTAVHFHYAGFVLPLLTGVSGRVLEGRARRAFVPLGAVVLVGPGLIGLGIAFSALVEVLAVTAFTIAVALLAVLWLVAVVPARDDRRQQVALAGSAVVLPASMVLALLFALSQFFGRPIAGLDLQLMVDLHGQLNALGFALLGVLGWRLAPPRSRVPAPGIPTSALSAGRRVGASFFERAGVADGDEPAGQVASVDAFDRPDFDADAVHPEVRRLYERTGEYDVVYRTTWHHGFRIGAAIATRLTAALGQLALPAPGAGVRRAEGRIVSIDDAADGRADVRGWIRTDAETGRAVFVSAYSTHEYDGETFTNVALPLPGGSLTAVLRWDELDAGDGSTGVELQSRPRQAGGDPGVYFTTARAAVRLPIHERFRVWPADAPRAPAVSFATDESVLVARHEMWLLGRQFLTIEYAIERAG